MAQYFGLVLIGALAFLILWREGLFKSKPALFLGAALICAAMLLRGACLEHETLDYQNFLTRWVRFFRENGGFRALSQSVGNYNVPYLYFLALFSYSSIRDLYLIKLLSTLFDVILAWGVLRLARRFRPSAALIGFFVTMFLPTVVLNGAYWAQCDSIYAAFAVWSVALALENKPVRSVAAIALSFAFKLQAVFLMPVFLIFLFAKKIKWYHLGVFPLTYLIVALPAVLAGRPPLDTVLLYFDQAGSVGGGLNYNSSSVYAFFRGAESTPLTSGLGIAAALAFLLLLFLFCRLRRGQLNDRALLACALLTAVAVPFLLPHMHDRYFFIADTLSVAFAVMTPMLAHVPVCVSFASLMGYHAYLTQRWFLNRPQSLAWGAAALLAVILTLCLYLAAATGGFEKKRLTNRGNLL